MNDIGMNASDIAGISGFHNKLIAAYGPEGIDAVGWLSDASQKARYKVIANMADYSHQHVLDAGCGHADLFPYLSNIFTNISYTGIEQMPQLLEVAIKRYRQLAGTQFLHADFSEHNMPVADYVVACGSLSYRTSDPQYIFTIIKKLFAQSRRGFCFNLLSALKYPDPAIVAYNPAEILAFCKTLTAHTRLETGYWEHDFTVMMYQSVEP